MAVVLKEADIAAERELVLHARLPVTPRVVNVLTQVRRHIAEDEDLLDLAENFLAHGQQSAGAVVALTPEQAEHYVAEVNELWGKRHRVADLVRCSLQGEGYSGEYYLVVIFGHRRLRASELAVKLLKRSKYQEKYPDTVFNGTYLCDIHFGLSVEQAIGLQFSENRYVPIPLHEEVMAASMAWRFMRKRNPELTQSAFGKVIGRSPEWVRNMLRFTSLPERVQELIEPNGSEDAEADEVKPTAPYHLLVQEARLVEAQREHGREVSEGEIVERVLRLIIHRVKPSDYAKEVSSRIQELKSGQRDLLLEGGEERSLRRVAVPHLIEAVHAALGYWQAVEILRRHGAFGTESPFAPLDPRELGEYSVQSPIRMALKNTHALMQIIPHLIVYARREKRGRRKLERALQQLTVASAVLEVLGEAESRH